MKTIYGLRMLGASATSERFDGKRYINDWQAHVPHDLRDIWRDLSDEARGAAIVMALRAADALEAWERQTQGGVQARRWFLGSAGKDLCRLVVADESPGGMGLNADTQAVVFSSGTDDWATPQDLFDTLNDEFGFDLDLAADAANHKCEFWFGPGSPYTEDALAVGWFGRCWLNPPYSRCREFVAKAAAESAKGHCTVVMLVPSRTDTRWWHEFVWDRETNDWREGVEGRFLKGRVKFLRADAANNPAPFPSALVIFHAR